MKAAGGQQTRVISPNTATERVWQIPLTCTVVCILAGADGVVA